MQLRAISHPAVDFGITAGLRYARTQPLVFGWPSHPSPARSGSVFRGGVVNLLEMPNAGFHYSVIGGNISALLACAEIDCRLLNDEVSALGGEFAAPDADAVRVLTMLLHSRI